MKFPLAATAILLAAGIAATSPAQTTSFTPPSQQPSAPPSGKVILSRSIDENGQTTTQSTLPEAQKAVAPKAQLAPPQVAEDGERQSVTFTGFDMDVHLRPADHHLAVRALLTLRNDGPQPLARIPLQISSSLNWERIRLNARDTTFTVATLNSDADHTGQLHEAAIPLATPLAPGATLQLDVTYSGSVPLNAQRLLTIGTPDDIALHTDWDQIDLDFTGLRGFGNAVWYPVSSVPVILGDGARLFDEIGQHKLRLAGARFRLRLTVEFLHGQAPSVALVNGHPTALAITSGVDPAPAPQAAPNQTDQTEHDFDIVGVATSDSGVETLGFEAPSHFVAIRAAHAAPNTVLWVRPEDETPSLAWSAAVKSVTPFLQGWLGQQPRAQLTLLDLPDPQDAPYETGALLATALGAPAPQDHTDQLEGVVAHALTHAWVQSPRAWLSEGIAHFMGTLWIEKQRGRDQALGTLEASRSALALIEPESPGQSLGQPLAQTISPAYYRTKAAYVFWMLRSMVGDQTLSAALRAYDPKADESPGYGKDTGPSLFQKLIEQAGARADLSWFFADWVNNDKGLPDLGIESVFPTPEAAGNWLVTVNIANNGYAAAEVPVTVRSVSSSATQRVVVPARGKASPHLLILGKPTEVQVNDGTIPETQASVHITRINDSPAGAPTPSAIPQP